MAHTQYQMSQAHLASAAARPKPSKNVRMGTEPIGKLLLSFAPPTIVACMCTGLYNLINTIFLGQGVGSQGIAVTTIAYPVTIIMNAFAMGFGSGGNARAALKMGEGHPEEAERCLGNTIFLNIVVDLVLMAIMLLALDPILYVCGATESNIEMARTYTSILICGFLIQAIGPSLNNFIRTDGSPSFALVTMIIGCGVSVFFNWLFVMALGWGVAGGAFGTVLGQLASGTAVLSYFRTKRSIMKLRLCNLRPDRTIMRDIVTLGFSSFMMQFASAIVSTLLNQQVVALGDTDSVGSEGGLAVIGTINKIVMLCGFVVFGISIAVQPIIGYNYGARNYQRVRRALWVAIGTSTVLAFIIWVLVHIFAGPILNLFGLESELHDFGTRALGLFMMFYFVLPMQIIGSVYFQATGQPVKAVFLSLTRQLIVYLPILYIVPNVIPALFVSITPLLSLTCVQPVSDLISAIIVACFHVFENRRLNGLMEGQRNGTVLPPIVVQAEA